VASAVVFPGADAGSFFQVPYLSLWLWLWFATLVPTRLPLMAFLLASLSGFQTVFALAYAPSAWHFGNVAVVVMGALWLGWPWSPAAPAATSTVWQRATRWGRRVLLVPLFAALAFQVVGGVTSLADEVRFDYSSSRRLAAILDGDPRLSRAIVIGEPELMALALPYYRDNPVFLPQEGVFRNWLHVHVPGGRRRECDLGELLATAKELRARHQVPVVMALAWRLDGPWQQVAFPGMFFEQHFTMTPADREAFLGQTELLGRLHDAVFTNENYDVFVLR